jgi:uncharacterized membrane protein
MVMSDEIDTPKLAVIGVVGTMIVVLVVFAVQVLFYVVTAEVRDERNVAHVDQALARYQAEQDEKLHRTAWVDPQTKKVAIPIERAMELTVRDLTAQPTAGGPAAAPR